MQYLGGKTRIAKELAAVINAARKPGQEFWDPFCGGLSMSLALGGVGLISDANFALINCYRSVLDGWEPPCAVTEAEYAAARLLPDTDPLKAFCAIGCSFGGKWFGGYARDGAGRNYAAQARASLLRDVPKLRACSFLHLNFMHMPVESTDCIIYLDPPYAATTGYAGVMSFDSEAFRGRAWEWARHNTVYVSEYSFDTTAKIVWERAVKSNVSGSRTAVERLYKLEH